MKDENLDTTFWLNFLESVLSLNLPTKASPYDQMFLSISISCRTTAKMYINRDQIDGVCVHQNSKNHSWHLEEKQSLIV